MTIILYFLISQYNAIAKLSVKYQKPHTLFSFMDNLIPYVPIFVLAYVLWFLFPLFLLYISNKRTTNLNQVISIYVSTILLTILLYIIYLIFPSSSEMLTPQIIDNNYNLVNYFIQLIYSIGVPYNAFPSYHVAPLVLLSFFLYDNIRRLFWIQLPVNLLIIVSTVFVKYHFFVDIIGGVFMGAFAYFIIYKYVFKILLKRGKK